MSFESLEEIISYAIEREKEAALFYEECSRKEPFAGAKTTLEDMAKEERKHQSILENLGKEEGVPADYKFKWIPDLKRSDYMVEMEYEPGMHYTDILRLAMKREEKALKLYNELLSKSEDPNHKRVFKMLCQEEAKHKEFLEKLYDDYMACQGD